MVSGALSILFSALPLNIVSDNLSRSATCDSDEKWMGSFFLTRLYVSLHYYERRSKELYVV